jgi:flagellar basal-body rod protein FlgC
MGLFSVMSLGASGLKAQRVRMEVISSNLANLQTTKTSKGGPYRRRVVQFESAPVTNDFASIMDQQRKLYEVRVKGVKEDNREPNWIYDPAHPDANEEGYVGMPNINMVEEMVNMMSASRSYEANLTSINAAKEMAKKALELGK